MPGHRDGPPDDVWIPTVAQFGWLIVTRDSRIQEHPAELRAVKSYGAKMVALSGKDAGSTWAQLEVFMCQWRRISSLVDVPGPYIWRATRSGLGKIQLEG